jgi:hypothetical protein
MRWKASNAGARFEAGLTRPVSITLIMISSSAFDVRSVTLPPEGTYRSALSRALPTINGLPRLIGQADVSRNHSIGLLVGSGACRAR